MAYKGKGEEAVRRGRGKISDSMSDRRGEEKRDWG